VPHRSIPLLTRITLRQRNRFILQQTTAGCGGGPSLPKSLKTKNHASGDHCTNERPNKYFEPSAAFNQGAKKISRNAAEHSADYGGDLQLCSIPVCHRQSSSASHFTAGGFGVLTFIQCGSTARNNDEE
jgi:hypothetical protein